MIRAFFGYWRWQRSRERIRPMTRGSLFARCARVWIAPP
jgi:hypothetical protein